MTPRRLWSRLFARRESPDAARLRRAYVDPLTGLGTRNAMQERLKQALGAGGGGVVVMLDVDHFKYFNSRQGDAAGDELLRVIAARLGESLATGADLARLDGDEFLAYLPGLAIAEAASRVEQCIAAMREPIASATGSEIVTLSAGVATLGGQSVDDVWQACGLALYAAKARGRDRVVAFDDDTRQIVAARRELASTVVELQERNRALREEARTDALTGLRNRLALDEVLETIVGGPDPRLRTAAVAFIDVDHFGNYNHVHGDSAGDDALQAVAAAIRTGAREADLVFRKGGEEFVVVLAGAECEAGAAAAERIRAAVEARALAHAGSAVAAVVTVTVGVASGPPGHTLRQLLNAAAEQAMAAKVNDRRNRVHAVRLGQASAA